MGLHDRILFSLIINSCDVADKTTITFSLENIIENYIDIKGILLDRLKIYKNIMSIRDLLLLYIILYIYKITNYIEELKLRIRN